MKRLLIVTLFIFAASTLCADEVYFAPDGSKISKQMYEILMKEHAKKVAEAEKNTDQEAISYQDDMPRDYLGRPLKDENGQWITYPGEETWGNSRTSYSQSTTKYNLPKSDRFAAQKADRYKEKYLKSGKVTDLLKYRDARRKALGYE